MMNDYRKVFASERLAINYQRRLKRQGIDATVYEAYNWQEQRTLYTVIKKGRRIKI